jgi:hypothetical protein
MSNRLDHVLRAGLAANAARFDALTAPTEVAGNVSRKNSDFRVAGGYWATPQVYDVNITLGGRLVAAVGFIQFDQRKGALFPQVDYDDPMFDVVYANEAKICNLARDYARRRTGWELRYP